MSTSAKQLFDKASAAGKTRKPYLQLGEKQEGGGVKSTGKHVVKIMSDKVGTGKDPFTEEPREELQMVVSENGVEKIWNIPVKDKNGNLHYLVERLSEVPEGATISLEMKSKGMKNYIELRVVGEGVETPAQLDFLSGLGCDEIQGYLLGRPLPVSETVDIFRSRQEAEPVALTC